MVQMKNRVSGLLMETGVSYNKQRLHKVGYFAELMTAQMAFRLLGSKCSHIINIAVYGKIL